MDPYNIIGIFSSIVYISLIIGAFTFRKLNPEFRVIFYFIIISSIIGAIMHYTSYRKINNTVLFNLFAILEFMFLSLAIWLNNKIKIYKWLGLTGSIILTGMFIYSFINEPIIYNNRLKLLEAGMLIIFTVIYFSRAFGKSFEKVTKDPFRYILIGMFIYFSSSLLILTAANQTQLFTQNQLMIFLSIHAFFYSIFVLLIIIGFIKCYKK